MYYIFRSIVLASTLFLAGCGFVYDKRITGPYRLIAVDVMSQMSISHDLGNGDAIGRISQTVVAYGFDERFIVAKQHPGNDDSITHYYYLDMAKDSMYADPSVSVTGPLSKGKFEAESKRLKLPEINRSVTIF